MNDKTNERTELKMVDNQPDKAVVPDPSKIVVRLSIWVALCNNGCHTSPKQKIFAGSYKEVLEMASKWWVKQGETYDPEADPAEVWGTRGIRAVSCGGVWAEILDYRGPDAPSILIEKAEIAPIKRESDGTPILDDEDES